MLYHDEQQKSGHQGFFNPTPGVFQHHQKFTVNVVYLNSMFQFVVVAFLGCCFLIYTFMLTYICFDQ